MDDFRLKVFITAARTLSFTRTAEQLFISQPAVSKHVGELESRYKTQLFVRRGSRLELTPAGETLLTCAERLAGDYRRMEYEMGLCASAVEGELRLGASTTIAQYLLPPILARFTTRFPGVRVSMMSGNSDQVEQALCGHGIDLGMVESLSRRQGLHYTLFTPDELVLVARTGGPYART
ncbi:LysR family transcriptional regulator, partial [Alistipes onderdonkii]